MTRGEDMARAATLDGMDRFAKVNGFEPGPLRETRRADRVEFRGTAPDGREYGLAYEIDPQWGWENRQPVEPGQVRRDMACGLGIIAVATVILAGLLVALAVVGNIAVEAIVSWRAGS